VVLFVELQAGLQEKKKEKMWKKVAPALIARLFAGPVC
jgi:hypothetical protein